MAPDEWEWDMMVLSEVIQVSELWTDVHGGMDGKEAGPDAKILHA